jgi:vitamin B12/bleomycin/antimicrobial peptide transport system ATP-binding/permease protein
MSSLFLRKLKMLIVPYWSSEERWSARLLLAVIMAMNLGMVYIQVRINSWTRDFYNVLQSLDKGAFLKELLIFSGLATAYIIQAVYMLYLNQMLQIRWRRWLTEDYLSRWLQRHTFYRLQLTDTGTDNPDQRISEDINAFIDLTMSLGIMLLGSVATFISFVVILWHLSGTLTIPLGRFGVLNVPGYMVWAAIIYSILGTWLTMRVGSPLIQLNFNQQRFEADFRFGMVRVRENSECIAMYGGGGQEQANLVVSFKAVVGNYWQIMKRQKMLSWFTNGYGQIAVIYPVMMAAPRFFSGQMHLGGLMQTVNAFGAVQNSLSYLVNSYTTIARWQAVINRLDTFQNAMESLGSPLPLEHIRHIRSPEHSMRVESLDVLLPDGRALVRDLSLNVTPETSLLITGPSGCGKSTLMRALAGIWSFGMGTVSLPEQSEIMFLPQKPYLPLGTLREVLLYPHADGDEDERLQEVLALCGLPDLSEALDQDGNWSQSLSLGEQQRIAFARLLLHRPDYMFLDEATASLDEEAEAELYRLLKLRLPHGAVVSVGHRSTLAALHKSKLSYAQDGRWLPAGLVGHGKAS